MISKLKNLFFNLKYFFGDRGFTPLSILGEMVYFCISSIFFILFSSKLDPGVPTSGSIWFGEEGLPVPVLAEVHS